MTHTYYSPITGEPLHRVPEGATIPDGTPYLHVDTHGNRFSLHTDSTFFIANKDKGGTFHTEKQITATPLLVIAHTDEHPERRAWLKASLAEDSTGYFATDLSDDYAHWDMFVDPVEAVAAPAESWAQLRALDENDHRTRIDWRGNVWCWDDPGWRNDEHGWRELLVEIETDPDCGELSFHDEQEPDRD